MDPSRIQHHASVCLPDDVWKPTRPSRGSRTPALRSRYSSTGFIVQDGCVLNFESRPERYAGEAFAMDPDISLVLEQPPPVAYLDGNRLRHHVFDFRTVKTQGTRTLTAIKHSSMVERSGIRRTIKLISEQVGRQAADEIALMTELDFSPAQRFNAELIHETRRVQAPQHDARVRELSANINGIVTVAQVVAMSELRGAGFRAVVRLLADRFFSLVDPETRLDYVARIRRR